jgi:Rod binding domain-containing protein
MIKPLDAATAALTGAPGQTHIHAPTPPKDEKALKAARDFESMLLRHMLESLQKSAELGGKKHTNSAYQSMAVEALADGIESGGGLGLADLVAKTLQSEVSRRGQ